MSEITISQVDDETPHDFLIDASQQRECDFFSFEFSDGATTRSVLIKAIGVGIAPKALMYGDDVIVLANDSVWVLTSAASDFTQHYHQFPVIDYALTERGLLVFDHIGCVMLNYGSYDVMWRFHQSVLEDYTADETVVSLSFDDGSEVKLSAATGSPLG